MDSAPHASPAPPSIKPASALRAGVGLALIGIGLFGCYAIVEQTINFMQGELEFTIVRAHIDDIENALVMQTQEGSITLPETFLVILDMGFGLSCLWLIGLISKTLVGGGAKLLVPSSRQLLEQLRKKLRH